VRVKAGGLVVDGLDDDDSPSGRFDCDQGPADRVGQERTANVLVSHVKVTSQPSEEDRGDHGGTPSSDLGGQGVAAHLVRAEAEVCDDSIAVRPYERPGRPGTVGVEGRRGQPFVEDFVAAGEGFDAVVLRDAL
jgi:hypothetical protein